MKHLRDFIFEESSDGTIYCGDCREVLPLLEGAQIDLMISDPPYEFISKEPHGGGIYTRNNMKHLHKVGAALGMSFNPAEYLPAIFGVQGKPNGYIWTNRSLIRNYIDAVEARGMLWDLLIWAKTNPVLLTNNHFLLDKEYIFYYRQPGGFFNRKLKMWDYATVLNHSIGAIAVSSHPTEKPLPLMRRLVKVSCPEGGVICDPFLGSGTTAVVAKETGRKFIGIEIEREYCEIARQRLAQEILL